MIGGTAKGAGSNGCCGTTTFGVRLAATSPRQKLTKCSLILPSDKTGIRVLSVALYITTSITDVKGRKNNCFTGSSFECDIFFTSTHYLRVTGHFSIPKIRRTYVVCMCVCVFHGVCVI